MPHNYSRAEAEAARLLSAPSSVLPSRASKLCNAFESIAKYRVMGYGTGFAQYAADHKLYDQLVAKGLVVVTGEGYQRRWSLAPAQLEKFQSYVAHFQAEIDAQKAQEEADKQAAFEAQQAVLAQRRFVVVQVNLDNGSSQTVSGVHTGYNGDVHARNASRHLADRTDADQYKYLVVELASS